MKAPIDALDNADPGDEVVRKFKYQHAYGVVLLVKLMRDRETYRAIWCEQHEDLLAERLDDLYDAYQIKTRKAENGEWKISDKPFFESIRRFVNLDGMFPGKCARFLFVSNAKCSNSNSKQAAHLSPVKLLSAIQEVSNWDELEGSAKKGFEALLLSTQCESTCLHSVLGRTDLVVGPTEQAFEDELCQTHVSNLPYCTSLNANSLRKVTEALINRVSLASSLSAKDPERHLQGLIKERSADPQLLAKRITADDVELELAEFRVDALKFPPDLSTLMSRQAPIKHDVLRRKMEQGGLSARYEVMRRKALTAEQDLLDLATRGDAEKQIISQLENVVLGECDEANLRASQEGSTFGPRMLIDVQDRLRGIAKDEPNKVSHRSHEILVGVAGLLTGECLVWWSEQFDVEAVE